MAFNKALSIFIGAASIIIAVVLIVAVGSPFIRSLNNRAEDTASNTDPATWSVGIPQSCQNALGNPVVCASVPPVTAPQPTPARTPSTQPATDYSQFKPYIEPVCTRSVVPYQTKYISVSYMDVGQTSEFGGINGYAETCTASSSGYTPTPITMPAMDKTVSVGTRVKATTYTTQPALNYSICNGLQGSSLYQCEMAVHDSQSR